MTRSILLSQNKRSIFSRGITLIEVLIAISLLIILGSIALSSFTRSRNARDLTISTQTTLSVLRLAQAKTLAGEHDSAWGVHLASSQIILFQGPSYVGASFTEAHPLPNSIQITGISLTGGVSDIVFKRVSGDTDTTGTFIVGVISAPLSAFSITIDGSGKVYQTISAPSALYSRFVDARHRSFNLGWSIQTAVTLTLTFADPPFANTVQNIAMAPFFDGLKTKFDWSGTVTVGGMDQTLRIHTTSLSAGNTILSVDRDCRKNNKKLTITIDGKTIAIYEADCIAVSTGTFGGVMSEP